VPKREFLTTPLSGLNQRLDVFLSERINELTRSQVQRFIEERKVRVNRFARKSSYKLKSGEKVEIEYELARPPKIKPENVPVDVLYSDDHIAIIDKPSGMVVHPGADFTVFRISRKLAQKRGQELSIVWIRKHQD
jgi:23S rRNA pseudouridine1911/1915/1917 synthase